ncbi:MAG: hypothetical protein MMC23_008410 [Stictis urceolatum]|nr:hypothetical protein [Stictis urceolata]
MAKEERDHLALNCAPTLVVQNFTITFDRTGQIRSYTPTSEDSGPISANANEFLGGFHTLFLQETFQSRDCEYAPQGGQMCGPYDWPGLLVARLHESSFPNTSLTTHDALLNASRQVYSRVFSTYFSLNRDVILETLPSPVPVTSGTAFEHGLRMIPSAPLFVTSCAILVLYIVILAAVFWQRRGPIAVPRMPNSIGTLLPWIVHSRMLKDFEGTHHLTSEARNVYLTRLGKTYGFGVFRGVDGKLRLALDQEPPLEED